MDKMWLVLDFFRLVFEAKINKGSLPPFGLAKRRSLGMGSRAKAEVGP